VVSVFPGLLALGTTLQARQYVSIEMESSNFYWLRLVSAIVSMEAVELSQVVAFLTSRTPDSREALEHPHNERFAVTGAHVETESESRDSTPAVDFRDAQICLTLRDEGKPYSAEMGFTFGSDQKDEIDVLLVSSIRQRKLGISRLHFSINFNWYTGALLLKNYSKFGTDLESKVIGKQHLDEGVTAPLSGGDFIRAGFIILQLWIDRGNEGNFELAYKRNWMKYREEADRATSCYGGSKRKGPPLITVTNDTDLSVVKQLGNGTFGEVYKAMDMAGHYYAVKVFHYKLEKKDFMEARERALLCSAKHVRAHRRTVQALLITALAWVS